MYYRVNFDNGIFNLFTDYYPSYNDKSSIVNDSRKVYGPSVLDGIHYVCMKKWT